jgi:hypothetical protein
MTILKTVYSYTQTVGGTALVSAKVQVRTNVYSLSFPVPELHAEEGATSLLDVHHLSQVLQAVKYYLWITPMILYDGTVPFGGIVSSVEWKGELNHANLAGTKVG